MGERLPSSMATPTKEQTMRKLTFIALALLAGCSFRGTTTYHSGNTYTGTLPPSPVPGNPPDYLIDANYPLTPPIGVYGITTNGQGDWYIEWQGDSGTHNFQGDVYCPAGCDIVIAKFT